MYIYNCLLWALGTITIATALAVVLFVEVTLQVDKEYNSYPDLVIPCISALKNLVLYSPKLRQELSRNISLFSCTVRG
jgi:hypothetical protein